MTISNMTLDSYPILTLAERERRWSRTRKLIEESQLDALIVFGLKGRERYEGYLSNESIDGVVVFPASGEPIYLTWTHHRVSRRLTETCLLYTSRCV